MKACRKALTMFFGFCFMFVVVQAAPILDCPAMCNPNEICSCMVKDCSNGVIILQNRVGQPINMTALLLSGDFPTVFFSNDNYNRSFSTSSAGVVGVKLMCFSSQVPGRTEKTIAISPGQGSSAKNTDTGSLDSKTLAQEAIQKLEAAINNTSGGSGGEAVVSLNQAKDAMSSGDYEYALKYANEGYSRIESGQNATESDDSLSVNSLINTITSTDPLYLGIAAAALIIAIVALVYIRKKRREKPSSGIVMGDFVKENIFLNIIWI